jgi:hypothetical protein
MREAAPPFLHTSSRCGASLSTEYVSMAWYLVKKSRGLHFYLLKRGISYSVKCWRLIRTGRLSITTKNIVSQILICDCWIRVKELTSILNRRCYCKGKSEGFMCSGLQH